MKYQETNIPGLCVVELEKREDLRGFFARVFDTDEFKKRGFMDKIVQINTSYSVKKGTIRGMHFQKAPFAEVKLVSCVKGALYDVAVDLRPESPTFKQWFGVELLENSGKMLYVPEGFAHGFLTLKEDTSALYFVSQFYSPGAEGGVRYNDPTFGIAWPQEVVEVSDKDGAWPDFKS